ncbi:MAG: PEP-CTERM sorting domain-containing protein [Pseudomonadales bacterium]|nr:PEP-CTERM sorting domain-containing protein [Pseudomonadales bacterium]
MKNITKAVAFLFIGISTNANALMDGFDVSIGISYGYQIYELGNLSGGLDFSLQVEEDADPVSAFAVGFDGIPGTSYSASAPEGWTGTTGTSDQWVDQAQDLFDIPWDTFVGYDKISEEEIDFFALFVGDEGAEIGATGDTPVEGFSVTSEDGDLVPHSPFVVLAAGQTTGGSISSKIPEPSSLALFGLGVLGLSALRKKK